MRIIGHIEHPTLKITVFKMDSRLSLKIENALYEQTFKFGDDLRVTGMEAMRQIADAAFVQAAQANFQAMHQARMAALARAYPVELEAFEEII